MDKVETSMMKVNINHGGETVSVFEIIDKEINFGTVRILCPVRRVIIDHGKRESRDSHAPLVVMIANQAFMTNF